MEKIKFGYCGTLTVSDLKGYTAQAIKHKGSVEMSQKFLSAVNNLTSFKEVYNIACNYVVFTDVDIAEFKNAGLI